MKKKKPVLAIVLGVLSAVFIIISIAELVLILKADGSVSTAVSAAKSNVNYAELNAEYEALSAQYDTLGRELNTAKAEGIQNTEKVEELEAELEDVNDLLSSYEEIFESYDTEGSDGDGVILSEAFKYMGTDWNLLNNYEFATSGNTSTVSMIPVNTDYYYCAYASSGNVTITAYSEDYAVISTEKYDATKGAFFTFSDDVSHISFSVSKSAKSSAVLVTTGISRDNPETPSKKRAFYVVSKNSPVTLSPSTAVNYVVSGGVVLILPGTYNDQISAQNKTITLLGVDRDTCIIKSTSSDYMTPPLEIAAGTVKNLSFIVEKIKAATTDLLAYAVHADYAYSEGRSLTISNCNLSSDFNSALGVGLWPRETLKVENCNLTSAAGGVVFMHDNGTVTGSQSFIMTGCNITDTSGIGCIRLRAMNAEGSSVSLTFKNNTLSASSGIFVDATNEVSGTYTGFWNNLQGFTLTADSAGNNTSELNY